MEIETPKDFFDTILLTRFKSEKAKGVDIIVQVRITGPKGGDWIVEIKDQKMKVLTGTHSSPTLNIEMTDSDFLDMVNEKLSAQKAFFTGKIKFKGDLTLALKLRDTGIL